MTKNRGGWSRIVVIVVFLLVGTLGAMPLASAHCDAIDGPVVTDARKDLEAGKLDLTLKWISAKDEAEVKSAFKLAETVKKQGPEAKQLAEKYFFETVVRVHRDMEGEPYTGIKGPGYGATPLVKSVDAALASGSISKVEAQVQKQVKDGIAKRFADAREKKAHSTHNVEAGRAYVAAYVELMHYIEHVYDLAGTPVAGEHDAHAPAAHGAKSSAHKH